ncbi:MAG TPA: hypothetical protein VF590_20215 [Isosphaeraceae bacterium]
MFEPELAPNRATPAPEVHLRDAHRGLDWHRAETERFRVLVEFLGRPVHAHGASEADSDIITAYNLAVEAALHGIRRSALGNA